MTEVQPLSQQEFESGEFSKPVLNRLTGEVWVYPINFASPRLVATIPTKILSKVTRDMLSWVIQGELERPFGYARFALKVNLTSLAGKLTSKIRSHKTFSSSRVAI
jgi:hypothetical protein